jgi:hypothetical protein
MVGSYSKTSGSGRLADARPSLLWAITTRLRKGTDWKRLIHLYSMAGNTSSNMIYHQGTTGCAVLGGTIFPPWIRLTGSSSGILGNRPRHVRWQSLRAGSTRFEMLTDENASIHDLQHGLVTMWHGWHARNKSLIPNSGDEPQEPIFARMPDRHKLNVAVSVLIVKAEALGFRLDTTFRQLRGAGLEQTRRRKSKLPVKPIYPSCLVVSSPSSSLLSTYRR